MILLYTNTSPDIYITLTEKQLLVNPNYLFVCKNRSSNQVTKFIKLNATDISPYKDRYNKFNINVTSLFNNIAGEYTYFIYEQTSTSNTNENNLNLLESGLLLILQTENEFSSYTTTNTYKIRE